GSAREMSRNRQRIRGENQIAGLGRLVELPGRSSRAVSRCDSRVVLDSGARREKDKSSLRQTSRQLDRAATESVRVRAGRRTARLWGDDAGKTLQSNCGPGEACGLVSIWPGRQRGRSA